LQAGFSAYLTKPIKQSQLFDALADVLTRHRPATTIRPEVRSDAIAHVFVPSVPLAVVTSAPVASEQTGVRILLAEDNQVNQKLATRQLEILGYAADVVMNGREALRALGNQHYTLVLMDCQMPEMDGYEATQAIRALEMETGDHLPIIAMTANAMQGDRDICIAAGMDDYISKPIRLDDLRSTLARWIPDDTADGHAHVTTERPGVDSTPQSLDSQILASCRH